MRNQGTGFFANLTDSKSAPNIFGIRNYFRYPKQILKTLGSRILENRAASSPQHVNLDIGQRFSFPAARDRHATRGKTLI